MGSRHRRYARGLLQPVGFPVLAGDGQDRGRHVHLSASQSAGSETALRLWTESNTWFSSEVGKKGRIKVGQLADLAVLSADYLSVPGDEIQDITSVMTVLGGKVVYGDGEFGGHAPALPPAMPDWSPVRHHGGLPASCRKARRARAKKTVSGVRGRAACTVTRSRVAWAVRHAGFRREDVLGRARMLVLGILNRSGGRAMNRSSASSSSFPASRALQASRRRPTPGRRRGPRRQGRAHPWRDARFPRGYRAGCAGLPCCCCAPPICRAGWASFSTLQAPSRKYGTWAWRRSVPWQRRSSCWSSGHPR